MSKALWFLILAITVPISVFCQSAGQILDVAKMQFQAKQVIPPSPEAAALGQYGNVPVSLFTGTPTVSIPLYELTGNAITLPIGLSYNASGFKPEDAATWCGSSWSLNAGGVITRATRGNPDNSSNYFGVANVLNPPSNSDFFPQATYLKNIQDGLIEAQPDIYYYNFAGHSGKFVVKPDNTVFKKEKDLKAISYDGSFTIVDEQGITYVFDEVETSTMTPSDDFGQSSTMSYTFSSAWYLRSMTSPAGDEVIEFEYHTNLSGAVQNGNRVNNRSVSYTYGVKAPNTSCALSFNGGSISTLPPPEVLIYRKFVKKIIYKRVNTIIAYIDILSATGQRQDTEDTYARRLNQVKVYSTNNTVDKLIKQYDFTYDYFFNNANTSNKRRLRLDSLQEVSVDGVTASPPAYTFTYDATPIPERFTTSLDHWGFYNAAANTSLVPTVNFAGVLVDNTYFPARTIGEGANREANLAGSVATMLNKMTYPTGGYTTFEYELNEAQFGDGLYHPVGGIRIKKIIDYSFNGVAARAKAYTYLSDDGTGSGKSGLFPFYQTNSSYHHYLTPFHFAPDDCELLQENFEYSLYTITVSANSTFGLGSFQGSHLGYTQVTESQIDLANNQSLGKTVYNYSYAAPFPNDENIENGDLVRQRVYRNDGKLLQEIVNTYNTTDGDVLYCVLAKPQPEQSNMTNYCRSATNIYYPYGYWQSPHPSCVEFRTIPTLCFPEISHFVQQNKRLTQTITKVYDELSNQYRVITKDLYYDNPLHNYVTRTEETTSNGTKLKNSIKYVVDYAVAPSATAGSIAYNINLMQQKNMVSFPVEKLQYRQDAGGANTRYISGQLTDYIVGKPSRIYLLEAKPLLTSVTASSISSSVFTYDSHYRLAGFMKYDANENLTEQSKTNDAPKSYIWDYNNVYPVAEVTGAHDNEVWYTSFETTSKGGFTFTGSPVADASSPTGKQCYNLTSNSIAATVLSSTTYILSYWRKSASGSFSVSGSIGVKQGPVKNNWTYFEHTVTGTTTATVSGSGYIDEVRLYPSSALMTTSTYDPFIGAQSACDVNNNISYYSYDGLSRLVNIKDDDGNIVKSFQYNYGLGTAPTQSAQSLFYNASAQGTFTKQACSPGSFGEEVIYTVPYGKYAALSQAAANSMATADIATNGQNYANSIGRCYWLSALKTQSFVKNDCLPEQGPGEPFMYTVYAGKYKSFISQADADAMATAEIAALPPNYGNTGSCSCTFDGRRYINGNCEQGEKIIIGGVWETDHYVCTYYYHFSDGYNSGFYYQNQSEPCPIAP
jgi:hypothetical protein